jgi:hypothetical protein
MHVHVQVGIHCATYSQPCKTSNDVYCCLRVTRAKRGCGFGAANWTRACFVLSNHTRLNQEHVSVTVGVKSDYTIYARIITLSLTAPLI